jgi:hypothetical protein
MVPLLLSAGLWGCTEQPVFNGIDEITIHEQTQNGVKKETLDGERLGRAVECLYSGTTEIEGAQAKPEVIQEVILIEVKDRLGDRMFEFFTDENFKGGKGKTYRNNCMYRIIKQQ